VNVTFQEGQFVKEGDLLGEIDKRPFENQLAQAQGQLAQAQAQQAQARGNLSRDQALMQSAQLESQRNQLLFEKGLVPKQQVDTQNATVGQYTGSIQADQAAIQVAQAAIEVAQSAIASANLQLTYARITAPVSGRIGLRLVDKGNIVHASDANGIAVIAQVQPIAVLFNIPEDDLNGVLAKLRAGVKLRVDAYDRDDQMKLASGTLLTVDNQIDQTTGTSRLKAVFDNSDNALFPNQFLNVHLLLDVVKNATVITAAAVQRGPQGSYVYVVDADKKAHIRPITIKDTEGNEVSVGNELKPGELVVVEGTDKVQDGARVDLQVGAQDGSTPAAGASQSNSGTRGGNASNNNGGSGSRDGRGGPGKRSGQ
jgi:multidrug efflux system membrane fusion protein